MSHNHTIHLDHDFDIPSILLYDARKQSAILNSFHRVVLSHALPATLALKLKINLVKKYTIWYCDVLMFLSLTVDGYILLYTIGSRSTK